MDVLPLEDGGVRFLEMPGAFFDQLSQLPETCDPDKDGAIDRRLYPHPLDDEEPETVRDAAEKDWAEYVRPELETLFDRSMQTVLDDLSRATQSDFDQLGEERSGDDADAHYLLEIPGDHVHSWFQVLNRARIVLSMKHRLPFSEFPAEQGEKMTLSRLLAAHLCEHYAEILEILVHQMERKIS